MDVGHLEREREREREKRASYGGTYFSYTFGLWIIDI